jgi:hypothetical protein
LNLLEQSSAVRPFILPEVSKIIDNVTSVDDAVAPYETDIIRWLKPIIDLSDYHVYPMNGITEGLNWWTANESRGVYISSGDYQWLQETGTDVKYMSSPSAIDGNFKHVTDDVVALDLAYVGSTQIKRIDHNADFLFYSLSKSFGVRNVRTGWLFTKKPEPRLESLIYGAKYYNYVAHSVAETIISNFDIDYIHNTLYKYQQHICNYYDLSPSDSVWLSHTDNPLYNKFKRGDTNRVCITKEISVAYNGSFTPYKN